MKEARAIVFDLDDTLWDLGPVIPRAEKVLYAWYADNYPRVTERYTPEAITGLRAQAAVEHPELRHDLTELRMKVLREIARAAGYEPSMAADAFAVFDAARNQVELFADVEPGLARLRTRYRLLTLSNGNANLSLIGIAGHFEASYSARELGMAKPDPGIFAAVAEREGLAPQEIVHVGDHPENDILAARRAGMPTVWVNRKDTEWTEGDRPNHVVGCLEELADYFDV